MEALASTSLPLVKHVWSLCTSHSRSQQVQKQTKQNNAPSQVHNRYPQKRVPGCSNKQPSCFACFTQVKGRIWPRLLMYINLGQLFSYSWIGRHWPHLFAVQVHGERHVKNLKILIQGGGILSAIGCNSEGIKHNSHASTPKKPNQ